MSLIVSQDFVMFADLVQRCPLDLQLYCFKIHNATLFSALFDYLINIFTVDLVCLVLFNMCNTPVVSSTIKQM